MPLIDVALLLVDHDIFIIGYISIVYIHGSLVQGALTCSSRPSEMLAV